MEGIRFYQFGASYSCHSRCTCWRAGVPTRLRCSLDNIEVQDTGGRASRLIALQQSNDPHMVSSAAKFPPSRRGWSQWFVARNPQLTSAARTRDTSRGTVGVPIVLIWRVLRSMHFMGDAMDPARRGADRLARFYQAKRWILRPEVLSGKTVRSFAGEAGTASLRTLIAGSVVSFVPPVLPLHHGTVRCTHALAALQASGGFTFGVRVETSTPDPVAIVVGFCTNDSRGAWAAIIGALNFSSDSVATSRTSVGVFHTYGASWWLGRNFTAAASTGVTFRMVTDRPSAPLRPFFGSWVRQFGGHLVHQHLLALTDDHPELSMPTLDVEATQSIDPDDATLRLRGSLIFE